jgi:uncharacterized small protein (DUF1192 family)
MRRPEGFNLAFLDILACGLGAVVLILVLLKNQERLAGDEPEQARFQVSSIEQDISTLTEEINRLKATIGQSSADRDEDTSNTALLILQLENAKAAVQRKEEELSKLKFAFESIDKELSQKESVAQRANTESSKERSQEFLIGLEVAGDRIVIMIDSSASMLAESLLDITLLKAKGPAARKTSPKWNRAKNTSAWLLNNLPKGSEFRVFHFAEEMQEVTKSWTKSSSSSAIVEAKSALQKIDPTGGTNIENAISKVLELRPSSIYLITDGLPTIGKRSQQIVPSGGCGGITDRYRVTGECRSSLFSDVERLTSSFGGTLSVILLPLEGDPAAAPLYTRWALAHKGTLLSPSRGWP